MTRLPFSLRPHRLLLDGRPDSPPVAHGDRPRGGPYSSEVSFDKNMVIILAALLCALICALGLNSIVRCALRCSRRFSHQPGDRAAGRTPSGLKKSALRRIPVSIYRAELPAGATDCPICLGEFEDGEKVRVLPRCRHGFHVGCIDTWLVAHSSCPTCRQSLVEPTASRAVSDAAGMEFPVTADSEVG